MEYKRSLKQHHVFPTKRLLSTIVIKEDWADTKTVVPSHWVEQSKSCIFSFIGRKGNRNFTSAVLYKCIKESIVVDKIPKYRNVFIDNKLSTPRLTKEFDTFVYTQHQKSLTPLAQLEIYCVSNFVLDYMHMVCLGVVPF
nr:uncharacterized protein LOC124816016 [Hydra vulgaris]